MIKYVDALKGRFVESDGNKLIITVQDGTVSEYGANGLQSHEVILLLRDLFTHLAVDVPCRENDDTLYYLARALTSQLEKTTD